MSLLTIHPASDPQSTELVADYQAIATVLGGLGVRFERWSAEGVLEADADQESVLKAYADPVKRLMDQYGFQSVDVISLGSDHPKKHELRAKFLNEHTHSDFEVRFFVEGRGLFYLHPDEKVYAVLCEQGDLISVPAHVKHWFDMGANPDFKCIRLFTTPDGWEADFTGSPISGQFPEFEQFIRQYS